MLCFEVWINGKRERVVGLKSAEEYGVYLSAYPNVSPDSASVEMFGYRPSNQTYADELTWGVSELQPADEVLIRVVTTDAPDPPTISRYTEGQVDDSRKAMICSNCGRSHLEVQQMITAQHIRLCGECCHKIAEFISDS